MLTYLQDHKTYVQCRPGMMKPVSAKVDLSVALSVTWWVNVWGSV